MNAGLPGTGIGGLFYIAGALLMPLHRLIRRSGAGANAGEERAGRSWRRIATQGGVAAGILFALFGTGWVLGLALQPAPAGADTAGAAARFAHVESVVRWVAVLGTAGLLGLVLAAVEVAHLVMGRGRPEARSAQSPLGPAAPPQPLPPTAEAA